MRRRLLLQISLGLVLIALGFGGGVAWARIAAPTPTPPPPAPPSPPAPPPRAPPPPRYAPSAPRVREQANCRYGPGAAYLYEWGLYPGNRVDILGRNDLGTWVYVDPWTSVDRCWVKTDLLDVPGDVFEAPPTYTRLPFSELYGPPQRVSAGRQGDEVTIAWEAVYMTEDDYRGYLIEAWLCPGGQLLFTPVRSDETIVVLI